MPRSRRTGRPSDIWKVSNLHPNRPGLTRTSTAEILRNDQPIGQAFITTRSVDADLSRSERQDLDAYAAQFLHVARGVLKPYTAGGLLTEGMNRLKMQLLLSMVSYGRRDGELSEIRSYSHETLPELTGKSPDHPDVRAYLLSQGENEIYGPRGAWERIDSPDWNRMSDETIERLSHGLMTWHIDDNSVVLGTPDLD